MPDDIMLRVSRCVTEVLALEPGKVQPTSRLMQDLGADSLDLVELMFVLEQEFDITLGKEDLSLSAQLGLPEDELHDHEVLTPAALERLRERFPWADALFVPGLTRKHLIPLLEWLDASQVTRRVGDARRAWR